MSSMQCCASMQPALPGMFPDSELWSPLTPFLHCFRAADHAKASMQAPRCGCLKLITLTFISSYVAATRVFFVGTRLAAFVGRQ